MSAPAVAPRTSLILIIAAFFLGVGAYAGLDVNALARTMALAFALAACASLVLTPFAMYVAYQTGLVNTDGDEPTPTLGGPPLLVAFVLAAVAGLAALPGRAVSPELRSQLLAMLCGGALLTAVGVAHDKRNLSKIIRLGAQLAAAATMVHFGVVTRLLPTTTLGSAGDVLLTMIWIVGITNALCYISRYDGLVPAVVAVAAITRGAIALSGDQLAVAMTAFCLAGAAAGFLRYNLPPAATRLGNSGATFLGFTLACVCVIGAG